MVGLMEDPRMTGGQFPQGYGQQGPQGAQQGMNPQRGVAVPQPQGPNAVNILAMELQRTQARVAQLEQVVMRIVQMLQPPQQGPQGGGQPQAQPQGMAPQGGPMPQGGQQQMMAR